MKLRHIVERDLAALAEWLPRTAAELGCERWASEEALHSAVGRNGALIADEGAPLGVLDYQLRAPQRDSARVRLLAVRPDHRRLGVARRAALALEERLRESASRCYVLVPARLGLALYFWLRLGYRPLTQREQPAPPEEPPAVWVVRSLA